MELVDLKSRQTIDKIQSRVGPLETSINNTFMACIPDSHAASA